MDGMVHVNVKLCRGLPSLRRKEEFSVLEACFRKAKDRFGCQLVHFSVLSNHVHFLVQTKRTADLSRYMQGLKIRLARNLNNLWRRKGAVFAERFFAKLCADFRELRRVVNYILNNARGHGIPVPVGLPDLFSSAWWHARTWGAPEPLPAREPPVVPWDELRRARTIHGRYFDNPPLLNLAHTPGAALRPRPPRPRRGGGSSWAVPGCSPSRSLRGG